MDYDNRQSGQTLIALLFFIMVGIIVTSASILALSVNAQAAQKLSQGEVVRQLADTGGENALLQLLRDNNYAGETMLDVGGVTGDNITITVTGTTVKTISSVASSGDFTRKIEISVSLVNNVLTVTSWKEVY